MQLTLTDLMGLLCHFHNLSLDICLYRAQWLVGIGNPSSQIQVFKEKKGTKFSFHIDLDTPKKFFPRVPTLQSHAITFTVLQKNLMKVRRRKIGHFKLPHLEISHLEINGRLGCKDMVQY